MTAATAQTKTDKPTLKTTPDFSHRVEDYYDVNCVGQLYDAIDVMVLRSKAILSIIGDLHIETHINQINPQNIHWGLDSVKRELDDILAVVEAHHDALKLIKNT